jgi:phi13 family phage major tail protein
MPETYGFNKLSTRVLKKDLTPDTTKKIRVLEGVQEEGGPVSFDLTGLAKDAVKVFAGDREYYLASKGVGAAAGNFGVLDVPAEIEAEWLGLVQMKEGIDGFGDKTDPPYVAVFAESETLSGEAIAWALVAGKFNRDGFSLATKTDEDFTPEPGEYVHNAVTREITVGDKTEKMKVLRAVGTANVEALKTAVLGEATTVPEG